MLRKIALTLGTGVALSTLIPCLTVSVSTARTVATTQSTVTADSTKASADGAQLAGRAGYIVASS